MLEAFIRPAYQRWLVDPVAHRVAKQVSPQKLTLLACISGVLVFPSLCFHYSLLAIFLLLLSGYCDTLDGTVARLTAQTSNAGAVFDITSDRLVEFAVIAGLFALDPIHRGWMAIMMLGSILLCVTSFLVVGIVTPNTSSKSFHYSPGLMERAEAFIFFILMVIWQSAFNGLALLFSLLVFITAIVRLSQYYYSRRIEGEYVE